MADEKEVREPVAEFEEIPDGARIVMELPGVSQDGIKMEVSGRMVKVDAEGSRGRFSTIQPVPFDPDPDRMSVTFSQGVLEVLLMNKGAPPEVRPAEDASEGSRTVDGPSLQSMQAELERVTGELERISQERSSLQERVQGLQKDFANLRRRHEEEKNILAQRRVEEIAISLIEVLDNFERARGTIDASTKSSAGLQPFLKGIGMIEARICSVFEGLGIKPIISVGKPFDPSYHMSVETVHVPDREDHEVVEEKLRGYMYMDRVLRPSHVVVNRNDGKAKHDGHGKSKRKIRIE